MVAVLAETARDQRAGGADRPDPAVGRIDAAAPADSTFVIALDELIREGLFGSPAVA